MIKYRAILAQVSTNIRQKTFQIVQQNKMLTSIIINKNNTESIVSKYFKIPNKYSESYWLNG